MNNAQLGTSVLATCEPKVTAHSYRTKQVVSRIFQICDCDMQAHIHHELAQWAKVGPDNHQSFTVENEHGGKLYVQFSDNVCYIGTSLIDWGY